MRNGITVRDVMNREFVGVSESDTLAEAAELMAGEAAETVVVLRGSEPIGCLSASTAMVALLDDRSRETPVGELMEPPLSTVTPSTSLTDATDRLVSRSRSPLVVLDDHTPVGVLTERDVLAASEHIESTGSGDGETATLAAPDSRETTEPSTDNTTQSICEVCGSLAPELLGINGQQVCTDCRAY